MNDKLKTILQDRHCEACKLHDKIADDYKLIERIKEAFEDSGWVDTKTPHAKSQVAGGAVCQEPK